MHKKVLFILLVIFSLVVFNTQTSEASTLNFTDVAPTHKNFEAIQYLANQKIINGYQDGSFKPEEPLKRSHVAALIVRSGIDLPVIRPNKLFTDIPKNNPYYDSIQKLYRAGIVDGSKDKFNPNNNITHKELAKILTNAYSLKLVGEPNYSFKDISNLDWGYEFASIMVSNNIMPIDDRNNFNSAKNVTRGQYAQYLYNIINLKENEESNISIDEDNALRAFVYINNKWGLINDKGKFIVEPKFTDLSPETFSNKNQFNEGLAPVAIQQNGSQKWGYIDYNGNFIVKPQFESAGKFYDGLALVSHETKGDGYIDRTGKFVITLREVERAERFKEGLAPVAFYDGNYDEYGYPTFKWGYINESGDIAIEPEYDNFSFFNEGLAVVPVHDGTYDQWDNPQYKYGYIDKTGEFVIEPVFKQAEVFSDGLAFIQLSDDLGGFIDKSGELIIKLRGDQLKSSATFKEGLAQIYNQQNVVVINKTGEIIFNKPYGGIGFFNDGLAVVVTKSKEGEGTHRYGYVDKNGEIVITTKFRDAHPFNEGLAGIAVDSGKLDQWGEPILKYGFINQNGEIVITPLFDDVGEFVLVEPYK